MTSRSPRLLAVLVLTVLLGCAPAIVARAATSHRASWTATYQFIGTTLNHDWAVYDNAGAQPRVPSLVTVSHGALHVATNGAQGSGLCLCRGSRNTIAPYGRWDVRARASRNADHGFAIMLWPQGQWPAAGEIDLAEFPGKRRNILQTTVHYTSANRQFTKFTKGDFTRWHTISVIWRRTSLNYLLDGRSVMRVTTPAAIPSGPMHMAIQAGADTSKPSATRAQLDVDWVKITR